MQTEYKMTLFQSISCDESYRSTMASFEHLLKLKYAHTAVLDITLQNEGNDPVPASHVLDVNNLPRILVAFNTP